MKKSFKILLSVILVAAIAGGIIFAIGPQNTPEVIFDAATKEFSFNNVVYGPENAASPTTDYPYPDLFQVRAALPGDSETWQIKVTVKNAGADTVNMYVRAVNANGDYKNLFGVEEGGPATISATYSDGYIATKLHELFPNHTPDPDTFTGYVDDGTAFLGAYTGTSSKDVDLTFAIPITAGNEVAGLTATVDWVFLAEIIPYVPTPTEPPQPTEPPTPTEPPEPPEPTEPPAPELNTEEHFSYILGYPDGTVKPENNITRAETATILFRLLTDESRDAYWATSNSFSDVPSDAWYNNAVSTMANAGIINGYPDGTFRPNDPVTRAEYATMFSRFFDVVSADDVSFSDIEGHWAKEWILSAASRGFINGYPDGTFRPDQLITRAEAVTLTNRVLGRKPDKDHLHEDMVVWPDNTYDKWYYAAIQEATNSHEFEMRNPDTEDAMEQWLEILPSRDWAALEKQWASQNLDPDTNPNVYSSRP